MSSLAATSDELSPRSFSYKAQRKVTETASPVLLRTKAGNQLDWTMPQVSSIKLQYRLPREVNEVSTEGNGYGWAPRHEMVGRGEGAGAAGRRSPGAFWGGRRIRDVPSPLGRGFITNCDPLGAYSPPQRIAGSSSSNSLAPPPSPKPLTPQLLSQPPKRRNGPTTKHPKGKCYPTVKENSNFDAM